MIVNIFGVSDQIIGEYVSLILILLMSYCGDCGQIVNYQASF